MTTRYPLVLNGTTVQELQVGDTLPTLTVPEGGTGLSTLTANNLILGNGTSAVQLIAPGATGNILSSNGSTWASIAVPTWNQNTTGTAANLSGTPTLPSGTTLVMPVLGTPASGDLSNCTNAIGYGLKSATTVVSISAATAPTTGQVLVATNSTTAQWQTPAVSLPTQTGNSGKYLTTDGSSASWTTVSGSGGGLTSTDIKTANYTAVANDLVRVNATSAFNITMPASPVDGTMIGIIDIAKTFNTNNITILPGSGSTIESDTSVILDVNSMYAVFTYISSTTNWRLLTIPVSIPATSSTSLQVSPLKTSTYTASSNELVRVNTTSGAFSVTLPATPVDGAIVGVIDIASTFGTNALTVLPGAGATIESDTSVILDINHAYVEFIYSTTSTNWLVKGTPTNNNSIVNLMLDDISNQFDGATSVFNLTTNCTALNTIIDSKDLEVFVNGLKLSPYVDQVRYPWITPYDSFAGFRVKSNQLIIYKSPFVGSTASLTVRSISSSRQTQKYPFNAITIALGD